MNTVTLPTYVIGTDSMKNVAAVARDSKMSPSGKSIIKSVDEWITEAMLREPLRPLWGKLWYQGEICCLFADTNVGKSIYAMQVASSVARRFGKVLFYDFEMSDSQLMMRYSNSETSTRYFFGPNLRRVEVKDKSVWATVDSIMREIEECVVAEDAKYLIIDNITWLSVQTEAGDSAGELMQKLIDMRNRLGLSILVLAHTPKREAGAPLTVNDLAGSKRLANFMDSIFCIGKVEGQPTRRYVKQIKARSTAIELHDDNVCICDLIVHNDMLCFRKLGYGSEAALIRPRHGNTTTIEREQEIAELLRQGCTYDKIVEQTGCSRKLVARISAALKKEETLTLSDLDTDTPEGADTVAARAA